MKYFVKEKSNKEADDTVDKVCIAFRRQSAIRGRKLEKFRRVLPRYKNTVKNRNWINALGIGTLQFLMVVSPLFYFSTLIPIPRCDIFIFEIFIYPKVSCCIRRGENLYQKEPGSDDSVYIPKDKTPFDITLYVQSFRYAVYIKYPSFTTRRHRVAIPNTKPVSLLFEINVYLIYEDYVAE